MTKTHLIIPDQHAHPDFSNKRADYVGQLIKDIKPDVVVNLGDAADLASLASYDKGKASFFGRSYEKDIEAHLDFQERMWQPVRKAKKKLPHRVVLEGNHEHRIKRAIDQDPELAGSRYGLSFKDLAFEDYYDEVVEYSGSTPGIRVLDGIAYAHYFVSGVMGRAISSSHHGHALTTKLHHSATCGHAHYLSYDTSNVLGGRPIHGLVAGVYQDYDSPWAGEVNNLWWRGLVVKRNVEGGNYSPQFISMEELEREYG